MIQAVTLLFALAQSPPPPAKAGAARPLVIFETTAGTIKIALNPSKARTTVDNFLAYVRSGFYDGTIFHRVVPGFVIQGGGMDSAMKPRSTRPPIKNEASNGLKNLRGTLSMARTPDPDSATSQFFINVKDNAALDYGVSGAGYAVFGEVVDGMDVVDKIVLAPRSGRETPATPVVIKSAREVAPAKAPVNPASGKPKP